MSPTDKGGNTPESPETPEPNGEPTPDEATPVEPINEAPTAAVAPEAGVPDAGIPIGGDYPAPEAFASTQTANSGNKKVLAIIAGISVIIIAAVAILLVVLLNKDDTPDNEAQVKQVIETFVEYTNTGELTQAAAVMCQEDLAKYGDLKDTAPPSPQVKIDSIDDITFYPVTATATITISAEGDATTAPQQVPMRFVNEDGWKLCS